MTEYPASWTVAMGIMAKPALAAININLNVGQMCERLGIGRTSAYEAVPEIKNRLLQIPRAYEQINKLEADLRSKNLIIRELSFELAIAKYERDHPNCRVTGQRGSYSDQFKQVVNRAKSEFDLTLKKTAQRLDIPEDTLKKFSRVKPQQTENMPEKLPDNVFKLVNAYLQSPGKHKKTVKDFCNHHPNLLIQLKMSYQTVVRCFAHLGFVSHKGIFLQNNGLDKLIRFCPDAIWGTDGKIIDIIIGDVSYRWVWQCLVDYKTTVIVGGIVSKS